MNVTDLGIFKLAKGSHDNPQQGVCFMEAVAWMKGEEHSDRPECACHILGNFGIKLNDKMSDEYRPVLNPLVLKMAGTKSHEHEKQRLEYLIRQVAKRIVPMAMDAAGLKKQAAYLRALADDASLQYITQVCAEARTAAYAAAVYTAYAANSAAYAADAAADAADAASAATSATFAAANAADAANSATSAANAAAYDDAYTAGVAASAAADAATSAAASAATSATSATSAANAAAYDAAKKIIWTEAVAILNEAIELGPHGGDFYPIHEKRLQEFKSKILQIA